MFTQVLDPTGNLFTTWVVALIPVVTLLILLAGLRMSAWLATLIGSVITFVLGIWVWRMPLGGGAEAYLYGSATGVWNVDWITFWGVMLFNTLVTTGVFDKFRRWLIAQGTEDVRVQTILFAWAFGALLHRTPGAAQMAKTNAAGTLSRKSVRTVRRSLILDARELWRSCCYRCHKVRRSLFRKVSSSWSRPASYSRTHPIQPLRFRKLRGDMPFGEPFG
jgi:hypothetical protein